MNRPDRPLRSAAAAATAVATTLALAAAAPAASAATLQLDWVQPDRYADAGRDPADRERHLATLRSHFERLAGRLPDGQSLAIDVLDVDLAGDVVTASPHALRVVRNGADIPRMTLRYALRDGERTVASGVARLSDLGYARSTPHRPHRDEALVYEKRMVDRWFAETFAAAR